EESADDVREPGALQQLHHHRRSVRHETRRAEGTLTSRFGAPFTRPAQFPMTPQNAPARTARASSPHTACLVFGHPAHTTRGSRAKRTTRMRAFPWLVPALHTRLPSINRAVRNVVTAALASG